MSCLYPLQAWIIPAKSSSTGKGIIAFSEQLGGMWQHTTLPCGQCINCRLERSRQWAMRCLHEAQMHDQNCFITLTFDDEHIYDRDRPFSLDKEDFKLFMKRFRKWHYKTYCPENIKLNSDLRKQWFKDNGLRYYHCGEYGEVCFYCKKVRDKCFCSEGFRPSPGRPHYHACIFGFDFPDRVFHKMSNGIPLYTSEILSSLWKEGFVTVGDVTFESAAYVARYILKKENNKEKMDDHYSYINFATGESYRIIPEYTTMSRRPGIGASFVDKYFTDIDNYDSVVILNRGEMRPPKYYDYIFQHHYGIDMTDVKESRVKEAKKHEFDQTPWRLSVKEKVKLAAISMLKRSLE